MLFLAAISSRSADLACKVHWTLLPNHALNELEMRYAISSSVKAPMQVDSPLCAHPVKWENKF
ncbi:hypothetical protein HMPREF1578_00367 [Gardnerella pickettii JCP8017B]|nr:hypothetical protein HMPREF1578_00367 [Gardnerella pickettii JCP8017B]